MKKTILWLVVLSLIIAMVSIFSLVGCKAEEAAAAEAEVTEEMKKFHPKSLPITEVFDQKELDDLQEQLTEFSLPLERVFWLSIRARRSVPAVHKESSMISPPHKQARMKIHLFRQPF